MQITQATIRTTDKYVVIDATVDGIQREGFVLYDGNTRDHEDAALIYLVNSVKLSISKIDFADDRDDVIDELAFRRVEKEAYKVIDHGRFDLLDDADRLRFNQIVSTELSQANAPHNWKS